MEKEKQLVKKLDSLTGTESKELIKSFIQNALSKDDKPKLALEEKLLRLKECSVAINEKHNFKIGDIVKWKPNLKNRKFPDYDEPSIVVDILKEPVFDSSDSTGSPYFNEPLDIVLGIIADEGEFISFYYDSRRFEAFFIK